LLVIEDIIKSVEVLAGINTELLLFGKIQRTFSLP